MLDRLLRRTCGECGTRPELTVAERITGRRNEVEVELTNFPYKSCRCGRVAKWAFDPGTDLSTQLSEGIPFTSDVGRCAGCGSVHLGRQPVELAAEARLEGFEPIGFRTRLTGFVCAKCGLGHAPDGAFGFHPITGLPYSDGAAALLEATRQLRLPD
jgi:hypothetical protein